MTFVSLERIALALADGQACSKGNHVRGLWAPFVGVGDENSSAEGDVASGIRRLHLFMFPGTIKCKAAAATQQGREGGKDEGVRGNAEVAYRRDERIVGEREAATCSALTTERGRRSIREKQFRAAHSHTRRKKRHQGIQAREGPREEGSAAGDLIGPDVRPSIRPPVCDRTR